MPLTVETGAGLSNADSLVSAVEVQAFASSRGATIPAGDALDQAIRKAHDYLLEQEHRLQGWRAVDGQSLPFPRSGIVLYNRWIDDDVIPTLVKNAIAQLVIDGQTFDPLPAAEPQTVKSEAVGPISTTYMDGASTRPTLPRVEAFLSPLFRTLGILTATRV